MGAGQGQAAEGQVVAALEAMTPKGTRMDTVIPTGVHYILRKLRKIIFIRIN